MWWLWTIIVEYIWFFGAFLLGIIPFLKTIFWVVLQPFQFIKLLSTSLYLHIIKKAEAKGIRNSIDYRIITMDGLIKTIHAYRAAAINRRDRMIQYVEKTKQEQQTVQNGVMACSVLIELTRDTSFYQKRKYLEWCIKEFDTLDDKITSRIHQLDDELNGIREDFSRDIHLSELALLRLKSAYARAFRRTVFWRNILRLWPNMLDTNHKWSMQKAATKRLKLLKADKNNRIKKVVKRYEGVLRPYFQRLHDFESEYLGHRIHEYQADFASFMQTVVSGRTLATLLDDDSDKAQELRETFRLDVLPYTKAEAQAFFVEQLRGRCGYHPYISIAELFEIWLRVSYHDMPDDKLPNFEGLGQKGFRLWLESLPLPAGLGLAKARYQHDHMVSWIRPRPPGIPQASPSKAAE